MRETYQIIYLEPQIEERMVLKVFVNDSTVITMYASFTLTIPRLDVMEWSFKNEQREKL